MYRSVVRVRVPLAVALLGAVAFATQAQAQEVYVDLADRGLSPQVVTALLAVGIAWVALFGIVRAILLEQDGRPRGIDIGLPLVTASVPPIGLFIGVVSASGRSLTTALEDAGIAVPAWRTTEIALDTFCGLTGGIVICLILFGLLLGPKWRPRSILTWSALAGATSAALIVVGGNGAATWLGSLTIALVAIVLFSAIGSLLTRWGDRRGIPTLAPVIAIGFALEFFNANDNQSIALTLSDVEELERPQDAFEEWLASRPDRDWYVSREEPYPVFLIGASGGGIYAAQHTATVLARLQDRCPAFAQHVFAISGVSGGSIGAALFASLVRENASPIEEPVCGLLEAGATGAMEQSVGRFMDEDLLAPTLSGLLLRDSVQALVPFPIAPLDRAKAFEEGLRRAWRETRASASTIDWSEQYLSIWRPTALFPALLLNTTSAERGRRVVVSPFQLVDNGLLPNFPSVSKLVEFHEDARVDDGIRDLDLATAVSLSARFPWVLPGGTVDLETGRTRLVDGGYFENSGMETIADLLFALGDFYWMRGNSAREVSFHIVSIMDLDFIDRDVGLRFNEMSTPVRAMLSSRQSRGVMANLRVGQILESCSRAAECAGGLESHVFIVSIADFALPLGLLLARTTRDAISVVAGQPERTSLYFGQPDSEVPSERIKFFIGANDQSACDVIGAVILVSPRYGECRLPSLH